jgi:hypothetical protein
MTFAPNLARILAVFAVGLSVAGWCGAKEIRSHADAICLDKTPYAPTHAVFAALVQGYKCYGGDNQKLFLQDWGRDPANPSAPPIVQLRWHGNCVNAPADRGEPFTTRCTLGANGRPTANQAFVFDTNFPNNVDPKAGLLRSVGNGGCLDLPGNALEWIFKSDPLHKLQFWDCHGGLNQRWWATIER